MVRPGNDLPKLMFNGSKSICCFHPQVRWVDCVDMPPQFVELFKCSMAVPNHCHLAAPDSIVRKIKAYSLISSKCGSSDRMTSM